VAKGAGESPGRDSGLLTLRGVGTETWGRMRLGFSNGFVSSGVGWGCNERRHAQCSSSPLHEQGIKRTGSGGASDPSFNISRMTADA
jgi:hypothetical protein